MSNQSSAEATEAKKQQSNHPSNDDSLAQTYGSHTSVLAIPGSPPWFSCQECGAYRSTRAGLEDLPCEPDRYNDINPATRVSTDEVVHARIDQVVEAEDHGLTALTHTVETGVRIGLQTEYRDIARGDEIGIRITEIGEGVEGKFVQVISKTDRVKSPTFVPIDERGESE